MKKIVALADLSATGNSALESAGIIAEKSGAKVILMHVEKNAHLLHEVENQIDQLAKSTLPASVPYTVKVYSGNFMDETPADIEELDPDLVVICSHGKHGLKQQLFGANVLHLVRHIRRPCLIVHEHAGLPSSGLNKILLTASPFNDFDWKMAETAKFARLFNAEVVHYEIDKYLADTEEIIAANAEKAEAFYKSEGVSFSKVKDPVASFTLGYSKQTLDYAKAGGFQVIVLSTNEHSAEMAMGSSDKENFMVNELGISILCCPDER
jgi:nucleotide-binding universal stress UspA family protein